jgi:hypothetical protein
MRQYPQEPGGGTHQTPLRFRQTSYPPGGGSGDQRDVPPPEDALPPGWGVGQDQAGNKYFYNKELNVTQWNLPAVDGLVVDITQIQKYKTKKICSLGPSLDLQVWLTLDVLCIQTDSNVEYMLNNQELCDNFLELVLESSTPFLVSVRYAGAFQKYASRKRSEDM